MYSVLWIILFLIAPSLAHAKALRIVSYDHRGQVQDTAALMTRMSPSGESLAAPMAAGLYLTDLNDNPAAGRPWWVQKSTEPIWSWEGADKIRLSFPWPVPGDGFSTIFLDGEEGGYSDGQSIFLNEEIAATAYRQMRDSLRDRMSLADPKYQPSPRTKRLLEQAQKTMETAQQLRQPRERARGFDEALQAAASAWQQVLYEHGRQIAQDPKRGPGLRWGLTLDESFLDRLPEFEWIADKVAQSGANWVRLVFRRNADDATFSLPRSFVLYDAMVSQLQRRNIHVMGSILDSLLWPKEFTPKLYKERTHNLVLHFKDRIRSWEVASEPNGNWIGGASPLPQEIVLEAIQSGAEEVKGLDPTLETVATLHWWEGTAGDDQHALFSWVKWGKSKGFGKDIDVVGLSIYPNRHPMGMAFDPVFRKLSEAFPTQKLMMGGFSFLETESFSGYWWLEPENVDEARKDLLVLYAGAACAIPRSVGGGFWWPTLSQMLPPGKKVTPLYKLYQRTIQKLRQ